MSSTSFYLFDEASAIPDKIFEVAEGGLTDGEPMIFAFGNPTRANGKFHRVAFGLERERWNHRSIDSRDCILPNKTQIAEWIEDYGEDSDFVRVRVRGLPPSAGDMQFIDSERVWEAQRREPQFLVDDPLICGVDVARGGSDWNVICFRRGLDARSIPSIRIPGEQTRDSTLLVSKLSEVLADRRPENKVAHMFVDAALGGPVVNRLHQLGFKNVSEINFGSQSPDPHQANMRAFMWQKLKDWLLRGAISGEQRLETDLTGPGFRHSRRDQLVLESKEDMAKAGTKQSRRRRCPGTHLCPGRSAADTSQNRSSRFPVHGSPEATHRSHRAKPELILPSIPRVHLNLRTSLNPRRIVQICASLPPSAAFFKR